MEKHSEKRRSSLKRDHTVADDHSDDAVARRMARILHEIKYSVTTADSVDDDELHRAKFCTTSINNSSSAKTPATAATPGEYDLHEHLPI